MNEASKGLVRYINRHPQPGRSLRGLAHREQRTNRYREIAFRSTFPIRRQIRRSPLTLQQLREPRLRAARVPESKGQDARHRLAAKRQKSPSESMDKSISGSAGPERSPMSNHPQRARWRNSVRTRADKPFPWQSGLTATAITLRVLGGVSSFGENDLTRARSYPAGRSLIVLSHDKMTPQPPATTLSPSTTVTS